MNFKVTRHTYYDKSWYPDKPLYFKSASLDRLIDKLGLTVQKREGFQYFAGGYAFTIEEIRIRKL